jgi:hypothetical protein
MPYIDFRVIQGKVIGLVLPQPQSDTDAKIQQNLADFLTSKVTTILRLYFDKKKSDGYIRRKFHLLLQLALEHLPNYIIKEIVGDIEIESPAHGLEHLKSILMLETGFSYPVVAKIDGRNTLVQIRKKTSDMEDDEFRVCYAMVREKLFDYCKQEYSQRVNGKIQIFEAMSDFQMFEIFKALYLGFEMIHIAEVETQLGNIEVPFHNSYLALCKMTGTSLTVEQFNLMQK